VWVGGRVVGECGGGGGGGCFPRVLCETLYIYIYIYIYKESFNNARQMITIGRQA